MITFDQLLDCITRQREPEEEFDIQAQSHTVGAIFLEWKLNNLTNAQVIEILNLDASDPELATVKTTFNGFNKADTLAVEHIFILAEKGVSATGKAYDKAFIRSFFGLS